LLLKGFLHDEVTEINQILLENSAECPLLNDPTNEIIAVLELFLDWYNHVRQPMKSTEDLDAILLETAELMSMLIQVFPDKSGTFAAVLMFVFC
jgi:hypothetical protein